MHALTDYERQYAEEHHALVYRFLHDKGLDSNEFYDVVIFRYLAAVQRYLTEPQLQQYSFTTVAYSAMNSAERCIRDRHGRGSFLSRLMIRRSIRTAPIMSPAITWLRRKNPPCTAQRSAVSWRIWSLRKRQRLEAPAPAPSGRRGTCSLRNTPAEPGRSRRWSSIS